MFSAARPAQEGEAQRAIEETDAGSGGVQWGEIPACTGRQAKDTWY